MNVKKDPVAVRTRTTKAEQSEATRAALLGAARPLFAERGYAAVATEEIVRAAGVTRGALYHHFAGKEDLFAAVYEEVEADLVAEIGQVAAVAADPLDALWRMTLTTALRRGELLALRWQDLDLDRRVAWIRRTLTRSATDWSVGAPMNSVRRSKGGRPSAPTRRYVPEPISRSRRSTNSCGKSGQSYPAISTFVCGRPFL